MAKQPMMNQMTYDQRVGYQMKRIEHALRLEMDRELATLPLTTPQYAALSALEQSSGLSNAELARRCFVTPQTMHQIIKGLDNADLLNRQPHPEHGRIQQLELTYKAREVLQKAHKIVMELERDLVKGLSQKEQETLHILLGKLVKVTIG